MKDFKRLLAYAKPYGRFWPWYLVLSILSVIFGVVNYALIDPLLTVLFQPETLNEQTVMPSFELSPAYFQELFSYYLTKIMLTSGLLKGLLFVSLFFVFASLLSNITRYLSQRILVNMRTYIMQNIRRDLFNKISSLHVGYFHDQKKGDILSSISNDVTEVQNGVANSFHVLFREPLLIIGFLVGLFYMSPRLTLVTLLTLPFSAIVIGKISRSLKRKATNTQTLMGRIVSHFEEAISGIRIIKAFGAKQYVSDNFEVTNLEHKQSSRAMFNKQEMASPLSEFLGISVAACVLFYGGWLQLKGQLGMDMPAFVVYIGFYWRVLEPAKAMSNAYASIQRGLVSGKRLFAILDVENPIKDKADGIEVKDFKDKVEFRNVSFAYAAEPVLKDINVVIPKGKMVAIVGPSGGGKSTMADLLPRFYDISQGEILLDGINIKDYKLDSLISLMGIVTQEAILFNDTVYNNIAFGMKDVKEEDVIRAAKIANAHNFITQMEQGYQTNIGDRGAKLSGGQRQRLSIARAILKNPPILILDEATSALDTESERLVQDALTKLMENRTSVVIAHRLSTIKNADEIIVLKDGEIIERGNHNTLVAKGGMYSHLCQLQDFK
ncbi:MAG: ABC transporter ATP-binding protein [Bacteroidales bacterium]|nr:ABC transporter ATP-binding protein [Bacteroidales bacterium]MBQ5784244.1 ABC transporter ATP-binding protein [Bacteroidales bacterium]